MYTKIIVPLDGSERAERILPHVRGLAELCGAELVLLHVMVDPLYSMFLAGPRLAEATRVSAAVLRPEAQSYLKRVAADLRRSGLKVSIAVLEGVVADAILDYADESHADLIVISSHGHGLEADKWVGQVTYRLLHEARVPVLLVRPEGQRRSVIFQRDWAPVYS